MNTNELFTLETLAKFYTDAAKAGGMEYWYTPDEEWLSSVTGPCLGSVVKEYRPKPAQPIVRWLVQFDDGTTHYKVFDTEASANMFEADNICFPRAKVIKLVEEQT